MISFGEVGVHASRIKTTGIHVQFVSFKVCGTCAKPSMRMPISSSPTSFKAGGRSGYQDLLTARARGRRLSREAFARYRSGRGGRRGRRSRACCRAYARRRRRSGRDAFRRVRRVRSARRILPGDHPCRRQFHSEVEVGRCGQEAFQIQSGIRRSRPKQRLCCQVGWARAGDGEADRRRA